MLENKRNIKQIGPYSFLFMKEQRIIYLLSFEIYEIIKIKVNIIRMEKTETYVFELIIPFNDLGTDDPSPQDTLKNISFIIHNNDFEINEEQNKIVMIINTKNKALLELNLYRNNSPKVIEHKENINIMQNKIQDLLDIMFNQEQKIKELQYKEENHKNLINKIGEITSNMNNQLDKENNEYQMKVMQYKNNLRYNRSMTTNYNSYNPNITVKTNVVYNPYLPDNVNVNNLLTRPEFRPPPQMPKIEKQRTINLDNIDNYHS